jgi:hypothetical protein
MTAPDVIGLGRGVVLLHGQALVETSRLISWAVKELNRRDGVHAPRLDRLDAILRAEAAANGHAIGHTEPTPAAFTQDVMSTEEVAEVMQLSPRHVRRKAHELGGRKIGHDWMFDPVIIAAAAAEDPERETND